jgi:hypothetical protein
MDQNTLAWSIETYKSRLEETINFLRDIEKLKNNPNDVNLLSILGKKI